jgi:hypothetical protein
MSVTNESDLDEWQSSDKTILLQLRDSAMQNSNDQYRQTARSCADKLEQSISVFADKPTFLNLRDVNNLTALAHRIMSKLQPINDPSGSGGRMIQNHYENIMVAARS